MNPLDIISLYDAKDYLRVDFSDDDNLITSLIYAAVGLVEQKTNYRLYQREEVVYTTGIFCYTAFQYPLNSATVINQDSADTTVWTPKLYYETLRTIVGWAQGFWYWDSWQQFFTNYTYTVHNSHCTTFILTLNVGYTDTSLIPTDIITALKQIIVFTYENRDMTKLELPDNILMLLTNYKRFATIF